MAKSRLSNVNVIESQFADDTATNASSRETFEQSPMELLHTVKDWGMTVRIEKTKGMVVRANLDDKDVESLQMENGSIEMVKVFPYLGSIIANDGEITSEIASRIAKSCKSTWMLEETHFSQL